MKLNRIAVVMVVLGLGTPALRAQESNEVEQLKKQVRQLQENLDRVQREHQAQIDALMKRLDGLAKPSPVESKEVEQKTSPAPPPATSATVAPPATEESSASVAKAWSPTDPIRVGKGGTYADLGLVATFAVGGSTASDVEGGTQLGGHDPNQRGFTVQGAELNLRGAVDPYFRGNANVAFLLDSSGETSVEFEEAWLETVSLPWNLQVRGGQMLTEFGRINAQHPHSWAFVDVPLVNGRLLGPDGLRNPGVRLSWLVPTPFYSELFFGVQNSQGETAYSFRDDHEGSPFFDRLNGEGSVENFSDLLYTTRYAASFDLTDNQTLLAGASAAFGPNSSGTDTDTQVYGVDLYWKWKSPRAHGGFPFVSWQTEAMVRQYKAGAFSWDLNDDGALDPDEQDADGDALPDALPRETVTDWGVYSQVLWGFKPGWVAGLRGDFLAGETAQYEQLYGPDPERAQRWRIAPNLTWYPSEFSKLRLQYNYDDRNGMGVDHSLWFQFEFLLGAHAAHKF